MRSIVRNVDSEPGKEHWLFLCSDLHIGARAFRKDALIAELDEARRVGARILVNGDVFDAIDFRDKRFTPEAVDPSLLLKRDMVNAVVGMARKILRPYAHLIDFLGVGNHDLKWAKWNAVDPVEMLITLLNADLAESNDPHRIEHGGICGFYHTAFQMRFPKSVAGVGHTIYYHHGTGGGAPVTRGSINFNRAEHDVEADLFTMGHLHNRTSADGVRIRLAKASKKPVYHKYLSLQTASYFDNYLPSDNNDPLAFSYAEETRHAPKPMGGWFVRLVPVRDRTGTKGEGNETTWNRVEQWPAARPG